MHFASSLRFLLLALPLSMSTLSASAMLSEDQTPLVSQEQPLTRAQPSLADLLTIDGSLSIFFSYVRELELSARLDDLGEHTTILAPKNKAILALARKPHEGPEKVEEGISITEEQFHRISKSNVERWVTSHLIPSTVELARGTYETMRNGKSINVTEKSHGDKSASWKGLRLDDGIEIVDKREASNGIIYVIDGTIKSD